MPSVDAHANMSASIPDALLVAAIGSLRLYAVRISFRPAPVGEESAAALVEALGEIGIIGCYIGDIEEAGAALMAFTYLGDGEEPQYAHDDICRVVHLQLGPEAHTCTEWALLNWTETFYEDGSVHGTWTCHVCDATNQPGNTRCVNCGGVKP